MVAVLDDGDGAVAQDEWIRLPGERLRAGHEYVSAGVHRLLDGEELLVVARPSGFDPGEVLLERGGEPVVAGQAVVRCRCAVAAVTVRLGGVPAEEDVADPTIVSAPDHCVSGDLGAVRPVVGRGPVRYRLVPDGAGEQVVHERAALAERLE